MKKTLLLLSFSLTALIANADEISTNIYSTDNQKLSGKVIFKDTDYGLLITPKLNNLPSGIHGFHIHEKPNCGKKGKAAGGHYDPQETKSHEGPYKNGHLGDLPVLYVNGEQKANVPVLAPRLTVADIKKHAVMIHAGGDNYSNHPPLGGGGKRIACGAIK